jgi:hypothetical protein
MKITARASGGFAGGTQCYELDTACDARGKSVEALLQRLDFFGATPPCNIGADIPRWEITVADGARSHTVLLPEDGTLSATGWQALLEHLRKT